MVRQGPFPSHHRKSQVKIKACGGFRPDLAKQNDDLQIHAYDVTQGRMQATGRKKDAPDHRLLQLILKPRKLCVGVSHESVGWSAIEL
jgi:hypothetical protein